MDINNINDKLISCISGVLLGVASFFAKIAVSSNILALAFFMNPFAWLAAISGLIGFLAMQKAFHKGFVSTSISIIAGISITVPVLLAIIFLKEAIGLGIIGIVMILVGVFLINY